MTNGIFKRSGSYSYARATTVMSTQSSTGFEWSVKLIGRFGRHFAVGIASRLMPETAIYSYDQEAILYYSGTGNSSSDIKRGSTSIYLCQRTPQSGDVVRFKFQPDTKKLIIYWVRKRVSSSTNLSPEGPN